MRYLELKDSDPKKVAFINYETLRLLPRGKDSETFIFPILCRQLWNSEFTRFKTRDEELLRLRNRLGEPIEKYIDKSGYYHRMIELGLKINE